MSTAPFGQFVVLAQLVKTGTPVGSSKNVGGILSEESTANNLGGASDLWGSTWTVSEINTALAVDVWFDLGNGALSLGFEFDAVGVTVFYSVPGEATIGSSTTVAIGLSPCF